MKSLFKRRFSVATAAGLITAALLSGGIVKDAFSKQADVNQAISNQIIVPSQFTNNKAWYTFSTGTISSSQVNNNFKYLKDLVEGFLVPDGHLNSSGKAPTLDNNCGNSTTLLGGSTDTAGAITITNLSEINNLCTLNFGAPYNNSKPVCVVSASADRLYSIGVSTMPNKMSLLFPDSVSGSLTVNYICVGITPAP